MKLSVTGRKVDIGEAFQEYVGQEFKTINERYHLNPVEVTVVISKVGKGYLYHCDITSKVGRIDIRAEGEGSEVPQSFDNALHTLVQRLRRHKRKLQDHHKHHDVHAGSKEEIAYYLLNGQGGEQIEETEEDLAPAIIAEMKKQVETLSVEEAVMRLDLSNEVAYVFRNKKQGRLNVIYRRADGNIGWIDPEV
jgi:ribosomal subunit interface protein